MRNIFHIWGVVLALLIAPWSIAIAADLAPSVISFEVNKTL
jgi:hypothetical protein